MINADVIVINPQNYAQNLEILRILMEANANVYVIWTQKNVMN